MKPKEEALRCLIKKVSTVYMYACVYIAVCIYIIGKPSVTRCRTPQSRTPDTSQDQANARYPLLDRETGGRLGIEVGGESGKQTKCAWGTLYGNRPLKLR